MNKEIMILSEGHEGDRHVMSFDEMLEEIEDIASANDDYYCFLTEFDLEDCEENFKKFLNQIISFAKRQILGNYAFEIGGVVYYKLDDIEIEKLWNELTDIPFDESENDLVLSEDWFVFDKGTEREDIWHWFDEHHSKGVGWLMNEYEINKDV